MDDKIKQQLEIISEKLGRYQFFRVLSDDSVKALQSLLQISQLETRKRTQQLHYLHRIYVEKIVQKFFLTRALLENFACSGR